MFYLLVLKPAQISSTSRYNLRNNSDLIVDRARLESYKNSFFPSITCLWNDMDDQLKHQPTLPAYLLIKYRLLSKCLSWIDIFTTQIGVTFSITQSYDRTHDCLVDTAELNHDTIPDHGIYKYKREQYRNSYVKW